MWERGSGDEYEYDDDDGVEYGVAVIDADVADVVGATNARVAIVTPAIYVDAALLLLLQFLILLPRLLLMLLQSPTKTQQPSKSHLFPHQFSTKAFSF